MSPEWLFHLTRALDTLKLTFSYQLLEPYDDPSQSNFPLGFSGCLPIDPTAGQQSRRWQRADHVRSDLRAAICSQRGRGRRRGRIRGRATERTEYTECRALLLPAH